MNYERWGRSLGVDVMPQPQQLTAPTSTKTPSGTASPQLVTMLPQIMGAVAQGIAQGQRTPIPGTVPMQPDMGVPEVPCADGYYRDAAGLCQLMPGVMPGTAPPPMLPPPGQDVPGTASNQAVVPATQSYVMPIATFVGGCIVGAVAMHFYMAPKKVTSNRVRRNRRRARR